MTLSAKPPTTEDLFETFLVGAFGKTDSAEYHRHAMNPGTQHDWKRGLQAVAKLVRRQALSEPDGPVSGGVYGALTVELPNALDEMARRRPAEHAWNIRTAGEETYETDCSVCGMEYANAAQEPCPGVWVGPGERLGPRDLMPSEPEAHDPGHPHLINGEFQSDKYPTCPRGKVPLSCKDPTAQDLLWQYAQRRREVDAEFATDVEKALENAGYVHGRNSKKLTESAYETLIAEDRAWLSANAPESLERRHIDLVLKTSIEQEYPSEESTLADRVGPIDRYSPDGLFVGAPGSGFFVEAQRRHGTWDFFLPRPASPDEAVWFGWALIAAGREAAK